LITPSPFPCESSLPPQARTFLQMALLTSMSCATTLSHIPGL
jgi:hypothetical protein